MAKTIVIVGAGHAAGQCIASLRQKKYPGKIILVGEESWLPYQRPPLSKKFLAGELETERLYFKPESFYSGTDLHLNTRVEKIDRVKHRIRTEGGNDIDYDKLVLATGSRPRKMRAEGSGLNGIHYLRDIDDVQRIRDDFRPGARLVVIGAGYIGLEVAAVATQLGLNVTVVEMADRVMSRVVSPQLSEYYQRIHEQHGVKLRLSVATSGFSGTDRIGSVILASGEAIAADLAVIGIGIVPNIELAAECGLETDDGIVVDEHCLTSDPDVFAIGDCTMHPNSILGRKLRLESVHNALEQAKTAAANLCGEKLSYAQVPWFWSDQYTMKLQIAGISNGFDQTIVRGDMQKGAFACLYFREGQFIAIDAVNSPRDFVQSRPLIAAKIRIAPEDMSDPSRSMTEIAAGNPA